MPRYTFLDKNTNEQFDIEMPYDSLNNYINNNPHLEQVFSMNIVDPVGAGVTQPPVDFQKFVIGKVKKVAGADPSKLERRWHIPKEV